MATIIERIDAAIKSIEEKFSGGLSNTSTKKFDDLVDVLSELTGLPQDDIYPTSVVARASNVWNRLSQGKPLNRHYPLAACIAAKGAEDSVLAPMGSFIGQGNVHYDTVLVISPDDNGRWEARCAATNARLDTLVKVLSVYENLSIRLVNIASQPVKEVVRAGVFSDLYDKFLKWLPQNGVVVSAEKYANSLRAISEPKASGSATGRWPGFFEELIGAKPVKGVYDVRGLDEFKSVYAPIIPFFMAENKDKGSLSYSHPDFDKMFAYMHASQSDETVKEKDQRHTLSGFRKYMEFLQEMEEELLRTLSPVAQTSGSVDDKYLSAIRTKPFILLAGISGTGKSRLVRQLAKGCCKADSALANGNEPGNFASIAVRPNWHDSTELIGYVSRLGTKPRYVITDFVRFLAKAWQYEDVPFLLCLDEMNLAPVEQYFAEYLSVVESRSRNGGKIESDVLIKWADNDIRKRALEELFGEDASPNVTLLKAKVDEDKGLRLPPNLIVMGTVNMDETTFSFSRKVLDRAMSFELNEVDMDAGLQQCNDIEYGSILADSAKASLIKGCEAYAANQALCEKVKLYLVAINERLEGTSFKIAYRTRDEMMIYCIERTKGGIVGLTQALDEATSMKILSRIEGDTDRITETKLTSFRDLIVGELLKIDGKDGTAAEVAAFLGDAEKVKASACCSKLNQMIKTVHEGAGFVSFWQC